jgi:hypothetical protein
MTTPHKWASVIRAWADGKAIQFTLRESNTWFTESTCISPDFNNPHMEWRVKPTPVQYKAFLWQPKIGDFSVSVVCTESQETSMNSHPQFIRWIDTEWQTVEV